MRTDVERLFDPHRLQRAREHARQQRPWLVAAWLSSPIYFALWLHPIAQQWLDTHIPTAAAWFLQTVYVFGVLGGGYWLLQILGAIPQEYLARRYKISTQTWEQWFTERVKIGLLAGFLGTLAVVAAYGLLRTTSLWWFWVALMVVLVMTGLQVIMPIVVAPLFFHFEPLEDETLRKRFLQLAHRAGVRAVDVYRFDMSKRTRGANAAVLGMGPTQRIVIADTLLDTFPPDEAETVLAHEIGHYVHKDILLGLGLQAALTFAAFYLIHVAFTWAQAWGGPPQSPKSLPLGLLVLTILGMIITPVVNIWLRAREILADLFAVHLTHKPLTYARALARLCEQNLLDPAPPRWFVWIFATHPPIEERIAFALDVARSEEIGDAQNSHDFLGQSRRRPR